jgi:hypothetical protein
MLAKAAFLLRYFMNIHPKICHQLWSHIWRNKNSSDLTFLSKFLPRISHILSWNWYHEYKTTWAGLYCQQGNSLQTVWFWLTIYCLYIVKASTGMMGVETPTLRRPSSYSYSKFPKAGIRQTVYTNVYIFWTQVFRRAESHHVCPMWLGFWLV